MSCSITGGDWLPEAIVEGILAPVMSAAVVIDVGDNPITVLSHSSTEFIGIGAKVVFK